MWPRDLPAGRDGAHLSHPRTEEVRALLVELNGHLPVTVATPKLRVVPGPPGDTHLYQVFGQPAEVRVTDQLLHRAPLEVIGGVLAHELAHLVNDDRRRRRCYGLALTVTAMVLLTVVVAVPGACGWVSPLTCALGLVLLAVSRRLELQADRTSLHLIDVSQVVVALTWLQHNAAPEGSSPGNSRRVRRRCVPGDLLSTHPSAQRRLRALHRGSRRPSR